MKYGADEPARRFSKAPDYVAVNREAIRRMFRQVGPLRCDAEGIAERGLCVRHLVLPNGRSASHEVLGFLQSAFDPADVTISLMAQYRPMYRAGRHPEIRERVGAAEYEEIKRAFISAGFGGFYQEPAAMDASFCIDFTRRKEEPLTGR
jgi:putative pyruvate formate lyase activating enzyme